MLGPLQVQGTTGLVAIRRGLPRTLLHVLLLRPGQTVPADTLIELLWGDELPRNPANALQIQISYVRKTLAGAEPDQPPVIETRPGGYALVTDPDRIDAFRFEAALRRFEPVDTLLSATARADALTDVDDALALWRGEPLEDVAGMEFARGETTRLDELRWAAIERRIDLLLALGRHTVAVGELAPLVQRLPLRERFREQYVLALYRAGRQGDALRAYEDARRTLAEELGIDPGPALQALERAVLEHDPALNWTPAAPPVPATPVPHQSEVPVGRLPVPLSPLIGRDDELEQLHVLLNQQRVMTLVGPAGAGKTRLGIGLAARQTMSVVYVDLSPIDDPTLVAPSVAAASGVTIKPGDDPVRALCEVLGAQTALLVLDTCEHQSYPVAQLASAVLQAAPGVRVLATSRRPLGLKGEYTWAVPPLGLPPEALVTVNEITEHAAVALFLERARAVSTMTDIDDATARDIAAVCRALDGLPLAIELAAARTDVLSPATIRARLQDRFDLLVDGGTDVAERQQTLRGAIDWSFDLLSLEQRVFFARLGTFVGPFELDAALAVAGTDLDEPLELLAALVRHSMVTRAGAERFRLLDTLRAYALDALAELDADDARERHARYFVELAELGEGGIRGDQQLVWLERLRSDVNNFRAALEWSLLTGEVERAARIAGALAWFWTLDGMLTEALQHLERFVDMDALAPSIRAKCLWGYGLLAASLGQLETARAAGYRAVELARTCEDLAATAYGLNTAAVAEWALGEHSRSLEAHREGARIFEKIDDPWGLAICKVLEARTLFDQGESEAGRVALEGVEQARRAGDVHLLGIALTQLAQMAIVNDDAKAAIDAATEALEMQRRIGYSEGIVSALHVLGRAQLAAGNPELAQQLHRDALRVASRIGHAAAMCEALEDLARAEAATAPAFAESLLRAARDERERRRLPLRSRDAEALRELELALASDVTEPRPSRDFAAVVGEVLA